MNKLARLILLVSIFIQGLAAQSVTSLLPGGAKAPESATAERLNQG